MYKNSENILSVFLATQHKGDPDTRGHRVAWKARARVGGTPLLSENEERAPRQEGRTLDWGV